MKPYWMKRFTILKTLNPWWKFFIIGPKYAKGSRNSGVMYIYFLGRVFVFLTSAKQYEWWCNQNKEFRSKIILPLGNNN